MRAGDDDPPGALLPPLFSPQMLLPGALDHISRIYFFMQDVIDGRIRPEGGRRGAGIGIAQPGGPLVFGRTEDTFGV